MSEFENACENCGAPLAGDFILVPRALYDALIMAVRAAEDNDGYPQRVPAEIVTIPRARYDALMAAAFWILKLRSLGYVNAGHGRKIIDETLLMLRAAGVEIKAYSVRDENLRTLTRAAGI